MPKLCQRAKSLEVAPKNRDEQGQVQIVVATFLFWMSLDKNIGPTLLGGGSFWFSCDFAGIDAADRKSVV